MGVAYVESDFGYTDAVGDVSLVNEKWGPSIGLFQIRSLRHPEQYPRPDDMRYADKLRDVQYNAATAFAIFKKYGWKQWSTYNSGAYKKYLGKNFFLKTGHPRADQWNAGATPAFTSSVRLGQWVTPTGDLVNNNVFSQEAGTQTITAFSPGAWTVVADHSRTDVAPGAIKSYPDTQRNFTNRTIDSFKKITATYDMSCPPVGEWDAAFDIWVNGIGSKSTAEVMVWTDHRYNGVLPPKNALETKSLTIDGQAYIAWRRKNGNGGDYIALVLQPLKPAGTVNLLAVFQQLVTLGWLKGTDKVAAIEYGVEIANTTTQAGGPQTFRLNNYQLTAE